MSARAWLWATLALYALFGALEGWAAGTERAVPPLLDALLFFAMIPLAYLWTRADARQRGVPRGLYLSGLTIWLPWIGVPLYLMRTRPAGRRLAAVLRALAFGLLAIPAAYLLGGAPLAWWFGGL